MTNFDVFDEWDNSTLINELNNNSNDIETMSSCLNAFHNQFYVLVRCLNKFERKYYNANIQYYEKLLESWNTKLEFMKLTNKLTINNK